ncbi:MAG: winged helix-turn-helix transcriptional regulator [Chloroflexi bacterium]|nr:winged helix-turn-helix transcriptional regulator [Chloroflexota bacterium]
MSTRSYNQLCGLAYALDIVGERWTILIIRELLPGPRRFKDLIDGLPGISTNLLTERLKDLEQNRVIRRRILPPPAGSTVYELTAAGRALEKSLLELGKWGRQFVPSSMEGVNVLHVGSYALTPKTFFRAELAQGVNETYALHIGDEVQQVRIAGGEISVQQGEPPQADMALYAGVPVYLGLLLGEIDLDNALAEGIIRVEGDLDALRRFLTICRVPSVT